MYFHATLMSNFDTNTRVYVIGLWDKGNWRAVMTHKWHSIYKKQTVDWLEFSAVGKFRRVDDGKERVCQHFLSHDFVFIVVGNLDPFKTSRILKYMIACNDNALFNCQIDKVKISTQINGRDLFTHSPGCMDRLICRHWSLSQLTSHPRYFPSIVSILAK